MIKGIFFDFDGVITVEKTGSPTMIEYIAKETDLLYENVKTAYYKYNKQLLKGEITHEDMWKPFCQQLNTEIDYSILINSFMNITIDMEIIEYIKELKEHYIIGMITDNKSDRIQAILSNLNLGTLFDVVTVSATEHARKTESMIFENTLLRCKLNPHECVFIDNTAKNLIIPAELGMKTILFNDEDRDIAMLKKQVDVIMKTEESQHNSVSIELPAPL